MDIPFDIIGPFHPLGYNDPTPDELIRVRVPRTIPPEFYKAVAPRFRTISSSIPLPVSFSTHGRGISLFLILGYYQHPAYLEYMGLPYRQRTDLISQIWLHISWPGYRKYTHTVCVQHDGTHGSIALGVARAYADFLAQAPYWEFEQDPRLSTLWQIIGTKDILFDVFSLRLVSLQWVTANIFQAEVDYVVGFYWI